MAEKNIWLVCFQYNKNRRFIQAPFKLCGVFFDLFIYLFEQAFAFLTLSMGSNRFGKCSIWLTRLKQIDHDNSSWKFVIELIAALVIMSKWHVHVFSNLSPKPCCLSNHNPVVSLWSAKSVQIRSRTLAQQVFGFSQVQHLDVWMGQVLFLWLFTAS